MTTLRGNERAERINTLKNEGKSVSDIAKELGVSKPTVYNTLRGNSKRKTKVREIKESVSTPAQVQSGGVMVHLSKAGPAFTLIQVRVRDGQAGEIVNRIFA